MRTLPRCSAWATALAVVAAAQSHAAPPTGYVGTAAITTGVTAGPPGPLINGRPLPRPALPGIVASASSAPVELAATRPVRSTEKSSWSTGAKDLAPLAILFEYWMMGNPLFGSEASWVIFFFVLAGIFMTLNMLQDDTS